MLRLLASCSEGLLHRLPNDLFHRFLETADTAHLKFPVYVTDGPFLHRTANGVLLMLWSSFGSKGYAMGIARSSSGSVQGPWTQESEPLWAEDGGHGMIFRTFDGGLRLTFHTPNDSPNERAVFWKIEEDDGALRLCSIGS